MIRHKIKFDTTQDAQALALAKLGQSTDVISRECGLTESQVVYRLSKAKGLEGHSCGYRVMWRSGTSKEAQRIKRDMVAILVAEAQRVLPRKLEKITKGKR